MVARKRRHMCSLCKGRYPGRHDRRSCPSKRPRMGGSDLEEPFPSDTDEGGDVPGKAPADFKESHSEEPLQKRRRMSDSDLPEPFPSDSDEGGEVSGKVPGDCKESHSEEPQRKGRRMVDSDLPEPFPSDSDEARGQKVATPSLARVEGPAIGPEEVCSHERDTSTESEFHGVHGADIGAEDVPTKAVALLGRPDVKYFIQREVGEDYANPINASDVISEDDMDILLRGASFVTLEDSFLEHEKIVGQDIATDVARECNLPSVEYFGSESGPKPDCMLHVWNFARLNKRDWKLHPNALWFLCMIFRFGRVKLQHDVEQAFGSMLRHLCEGTLLRKIGRPERQRLLHRFGVEADGDLPFADLLQRLADRMQSVQVRPATDLEEEMADDVCPVGVCQRDAKTLLRNTPAGEEVLINERVLSAEEERTFLHLIPEEEERRDDGRGDVEINLYSDLNFRDLDEEERRVFEYHGVILPDAGDVEGTKPTQDSVSRICGGPSFTDVAYGTDYFSLVDLGIVEASEEAYGEFERFFEGENRKLQVHRCDATGGRCQKRVDEEGNTRCRFPFSAPCSKSYFEEFDCYYDEEDMKVLRKLGLVGFYPSKSFCPCCKTNIDVGDRFGPVPELRGGKWHYAHAQGYKNIPTIPLLWAICQAATNAQECDERFNHAYLSSYAAKCEFGRTVISVRDGGDFNLDARAMENSKISGARFLAKLKEEKEDKGKLLLREVCVSEVIWFTLGLPYVVTNVTFVHVSSKPPELRSAVLKSKVHRKVTGLSGIERAPHYLRIDMQLPEWRLFSVSQVETLEEFCESGYCLDNVTRLKRYAVHEDLSECPWVDAVQRQVRIRTASLDDFFNFCDERRTEGGNRNEGVAELVRDVINPLRRIRGTEEEDGAFWRRFVVKDDKPVVVVLKPLSASDPVKFLYHLALSMGNFVTERDLFRNSRNMLHILKNAGLLSETCGVDDGVALLRKFVMTQLRFMSLSRRPFIKEINLGLKVLQKVIEDGEIYIEPKMPLVTLEEMKESAERELQRKKAENLERLSNNPRRVVETFEGPEDLADVFPVPEMGCVYLVVNYDDPRTFYI
ncbi:unnamed protein product, partial [Cyprideis torosa]